MGGWTSGDLQAEFERRLDDLLAECCPDWQAPEPLSGDQRLVAFRQRNAKRTQLGDVLTARPDVAVAAAGRLLDVIACDEDLSRNRQLIEPLVTAVGRRTVQRHLISVIETGPEHKKVCAMHAWYWSQVTLVYESFQDFDARRPTPASRAAAADVADLRGQYRIACLNAFVACQYVPTRERLADGFLLVDEYYPPHLRDLVARALAIAEADPHRYKNLLARQDEEIGLDQIGSAST
ncbi:hypothetical protein [Dactylosporangium sp. CA-233914]|uniref:hypothetical protein n=1 Tax=Dactylosporangium sp. CA-233914 TaxID=3239934 RepID=UPI003D9486A8